MEKLKRTARILDRFAKIFRVIFIAVAILLVVFAGIAAIYYLTSASDPDTFTAMLVGGDLHLTLGNVSLDLKPLAVLSERPLALLAVAFVCGALVLVLVAAEAHILHRILSPMAEGRPFDISVSDNLRKLGWLTLIQVAAYSLSEFLSNTAILKLFDFGYFFDPEYVNSYSVEFRFELGRLLIPAALFFLSWIFRYGEELQRQSDETL